MSAGVDPYRGEPGPRPVPPVTRTGRKKGGGMALPIVTARLDKSRYTPGEPMLLTVVYGVAEGQPLTVTVVVTDQAGRRSAPTTVTPTFEPTTLTVTVSDSAGRAWTRLSDDGSVTVHRAVA
ncbi:hypothetical protein [Micromonospora yangpuensis]